jgi:hypothetical protein
MPDEKLEQAAAIRKLWKALILPKWTKDDLIDFGKAIFSKVDLKDMPEKTLVKVLPFLKTVADELRKNEPKAEPKNEPSPDPDKL